MIQMSELNLPVCHQINNRQIFLLNFDDDYDDDGDGSCDDDYDDGDDHVYGDDDDDNWDDDDDDTSRLPTCN